MPTGTVTLLFSDMESSTQLLSRLGTDFTVALDAHRTLLREQWERHGGIELGTEGDSFFVAFPSAHEAVTAAVDGQRAIESATWPGGERVRVRIGIHTGVPMAHDGSYVGMDVHRAARISAAAHGGQILVSDATASLLHEATLRLLDLGRHNLKDLPQPEHLFQVSAEGIGGAFPPVRGLGSASSLPTPATPIVGRLQELDDVAALLMTDHVRLVTLTGPGGTGKTRLSIAVADRVATRYSDGVYFVRLDAVRSAEPMWAALATALDVPSSARTQPTLVTYIAERRALLVLDNLEQVEGGGAVVSTLLGAGPLTVLVTSRQALHADGEHEYPVPPLELPTREADPDATPAVQLFVQQATMVRRGFELTEDNRDDVAAICRRLDGLPLALELAAARLKLLTPHSLLARIDEALDIRTRDTARSERHQTLRQTIEWSYDLLSERERRLLRTLSVFTGGANLDAVEALWAQLAADQPDGVDLVEGLVDASLLTVGDGVGDPRVSMLNTVRAFAAEELRSRGEAEDVFDRFVSLLEELVEHADRRGGSEARARYQARLEAEHENLRQAIGWLIETCRSKATDDVVSRALLLSARTAGRLSRPFGLFEEGRRFCEEALAVAGTRSDACVAFCQVTLVRMILFSGETAAAFSLAQRARDAAFAAEPSRWFHETDLQELRATTLVTLGEVAFRTGDLPESRASLEQGLQHSSAADLRGDILRVLSNVVAAMDGPAASLELLEQAADLARSTGDEVNLVMTKHNIACCLQDMGRPERARAMMSENYAATAALRNPEATATYAEDYASVLADLSDFRSAVALIGAAEALRARVAIKRHPYQQRVIDDVLRRSQDALDDRWADSWASGQSMSVERAVEQVDGAGARSSA